MSGVNASSWLSRIVPFVAELAHVSDSRGVPSRAMIMVCPETPSLHAEAIEALYDRTFGPGHFAKTAERLRENGHNLTQLSRVGLANGRVVGVTRIWQVNFETGGAGLFVGPVAVDPDWRGEKLGLKLTSAALDAAAVAGWAFALVIGNPAYFSEIGFQPAAAGRFEMPGPQDTSRILYRVLGEKGAAFSGRVTAACDA